MSISTVATSMGIALEPHTRNFIRDELSVRRNQMWATGCSRPLEDEIIEGILDDLYDDGSSSGYGSNTEWTTGPDAF